MPEDQDQVELGEDVDLCHWTYSGDETKGRGVVRISDKESFIASHQGQGPVVGCG